MTVLPGATIGILGGGQLGRMTAMAARTMGYRVHALDPDPRCSAAPVVDRLVTGAFDDADAASDLARHCDVVTLEIEQIGDASLRASEQHAPVRPGAHVLEIVRDRARQRAWLRDNGFPQGAWRDAGSSDAFRRAVAELGGEAFVKATTGGYDGRSQVRVRRGDDLDVAWTSLADTRGAPRPVVVERALDLSLELSVLVARSPSGSLAVYPPAVNHHERQVLAWSMLPGPLPADVAARATEIARGIAIAIGLEGILAVELFLTRDQEILVNELAPRPHNSYHASELACVTSQFEQLVRAVCDLPLGTADVHEPAAIVNLFGDLWRGDEAPPWHRALAVSGTRLHLYGKHAARPGRKMGHISATGATAEEALARARDAHARLLD